LNSQFSQHLVVFALAVQVTAGIASAGGRPELAAVQPHLPALSWPVPKEVVANWKVCGVAQSADGRGVAIVEFEGMSYVVGRGSSIPGHGKPVLDVRSITMKEVEVFDHQKQRLVRQVTHEPPAVPVRDFDPTLDYRLTDVLDSLAEEGQFNVVTSPRVLLTRLGFSLQKVTAYEALRHLGRAMELNITPVRLEGSPETYIVRAPADCARFLPLPPAPVARAVFADFDFPRNVPSQMLLSAIGNLGGFNVVLNPRISRNSISLKLRRVTPEGAIYLLAAAEGLTCDVTTEASGIRTYFIGVPTSSER
jgi:hypothetical protein